jgi:glucokinase
MIQQATEFLIADIGGTKTDLSVFTIRGRQTHCSGVTTLLNSEFSCAEQVIEKYLEGIQTNPSRACLAVAGPVMSGASHLTNLPWVVEEESLASRCLLSQVVLINDAHALGWLLPRLREEDTILLSPGTNERNGTKLAIAPGTGLGEAFVTWNGKHYLAHASEAGNVPFAPSNQLQFQLLEFVQDELGSVKREDLCSGRGIPRIHRFLLDKFPDLKSPEDEIILACTEAEQTAKIVRNASARNESDSCSRTIDMFIDILASEVRNSALIFMPSGGIYIAGAFPLRIQEQLESYFEAAFRQGESSQNKVANPPVYLVADSHPVLQGAFCYAQQFFTPSCDSPMSLRAKGD